MEKAYQNVIEAASFGMPFLSKVPGNKDMIKSNGFLFEYDNFRCTFASALGI